MARRLPKLFTLAVLAGACGAPEVAPTAPAPTEAESTTQQDEVGARAPSLSGFSSLGFCEDFGEVVGQDFSQAQPVVVKNALSCGAGYGIELISLWGTVTVGYVVAPADPPTEKINGQEVGAMDVALEGAPALRLFNAMSRTWSVYQPDNVKRSQRGRVHCEKYTDTAAFCTLRGFVGFSTTR
jgi:hypothetical protein